MEEGEVSDAEEDAAHACGDGGAGPDADVVRQALPVAARGTEEEQYLAAVRAESAAMPYHADAAGPCAPRMPLAQSVPGAAVPRAWAQRCVALMEALPEPEERCAPAPDAGDEAAWRAALDADASLVLAADRRQAVQLVAWIARWAAAEGGPSEARYQQLVLLLRLLRPGTLSFHQLATMRAAVVSLAACGTSASDAVLALFALRFGQHDLLSDSGPAT